MLASFFNYFKNRRDRQLRLKCADFASRRPGNNGIESTHMYFVYIKYGPKKFNQLFPSIFPEFQLAVPETEKSEY